MAESRALAFEAAANNGSAEVAYGANQLNGRGISLPFTVTEAGDYQFFEMLVRQAGSSAILAGDMIVEVYSDNAGVPGTLLGRAWTTTMGVDKSTGSYGWLWAYCPSKLTLSPGTYHLVPTVNGTGSTSQAISFACQSGGSTPYRTRTAGSWSGWGTVANKRPCVRAYSGWPALVGGRWDLDARNGTILRATGTPSWEQTGSEDLGYGEHFNVSEAHWDGSAWRVLYATYDDRTGQGGVTYARGLGAATGPTLASLTKYNQNPLVTIPLAQHSSRLETHTPCVYDWTPGAMKGYFRGYAYDLDPTQQRILYHMSNAHANWYQPQSGGGWQNDGVVNYSWPTVQNILNPHAWYDGATVKVQLFVQTSTGGGRMVIADQATPTSLVNATPVYIDLSDVDTVSALIGARYEAGSGIIHGLATKQNTKSDSYGTYYFEGWALSSGDGIIYTSPYPLLPYDNTATNEHCGADAAAGTGFVEETDGTIRVVYAGVNRYYTAAAGDLDMEVVTNMATVQYVDEGGERATSMAFDLSLPATQVVGAFDFDLSLPGVLTVSAMDFLLSLPQPIYVLTPPAEIRRASPLVSQDPVNSRVSGRRNDGQHTPNHCGPSRRDTWRALQQRPTSSSARETPCR